MNKINLNVGQRIEKLAEEIIVIVLKGDTYGLSNAEITEIVADKIKEYLKIGQYNSREGGE